MSRVFLQDQLSKFYGSICKGSLNGFSEGSTPIRRPRIADLVSAIREDTMIMSARPFGTGRHRALTCGLSTT